MGLDENRIRVGDNVTIDKGKQVFVKVTDIRKGSDDSALTFEGEVRSKFLDRNFRLIKHVTFTADDIVAHARVVNSSED